MIQKEPVQSILPTIKADSSQLGDGVRQHWGIGVGQSQRMVFMGL